jgi:uncharacterized membrane protein YfcA
MDIGLIIAMLLQVGVGALLVYVSYYRRKNIIRNPKFWKTASTIGIICGWIVVIWSMLNLILYLMMQIS